MYFYIMNSTLETLPKKELIRLLVDAQMRSAMQQQEIEKMQAQNAWFQFQLEELKRLIYGNKRERFEANQDVVNQVKIEFAEYASEQEKEDQTPLAELIKVEYEREKSPKKHNGRNSIPDALPVFEYTVEPDQDLTGMKKIGEERTAILEYVTEKFIKVVIIRPKYARAEQNESSAESEQKNIVIASLPSRPIEKCMAGNSLLAAIIIHKYVDHLPLYRQQQIFRRSNIEIASSTIDSWVAQLGNLLKVLYEKLVQELKAQNYIQADETTIKVLDKIKKKDTHLGYYWVYHAPVAKLVAFNYQKGRGQDAPVQFLKNFKGVLQTDGYVVYKYYYANDQVVHLACWAHARRKFEKSLKNDSKRATYAMLEIQKLYAIERECKQLSAQERKEIRLDKALPIINAFGKWLHSQRQQVLPKSPIGLAVEYSVSLWGSLQNYLHDGDFQIDNNLIENTIRPIALGRKNYLFAGSHEGAERAAMFYSFLACCKLNDINPQKWLNYILAHIADYKVNKLHELLPNNIDRNIIENFKNNWEV